MPDDKQKRRAGFYWLGTPERPYISVTEILKVIAKPQLTYWFGQQVYYATVKDPSIDERTALASPYSTSKTAKERGTDIHDLIQHGTPGDVPEHLAGFYKAYTAWRNDAKPTSMEHEKSVLSDKYGFAGTMDELAMVGGVPTIIDYKTSKKGEIYPEAHLQVSAYLSCTQASRGLIVGLSQDGTYHVQEVRNNLGAFLSAMRLYIFINEEKLKAVGWVMPEALHRLSAI